VVAHGHAAHGSEVRHAAIAERDKSVAALLGGEWGALLRGVAELVTALEAPARAAETALWVGEAEEAWAGAAGGGGGGGGGLPPALFTVAPLVLAWGHFKATQLGKV
jgi:hypothetical protein